MGVQRWSRVLTAIVLLCVVAAGCDWQQYGNDGGNTHSSGDPLISTATVPNLAKSWVGATSGMVLTPPAIVNGVAYIGANDKKLYAFATTGFASCPGAVPTCPPLWTAKLNSLAIGAPAVANGAVFTKSSLGVLSAFDATGVNGCSGAPKTCTPLWTASVGAASSSPMIAGGVVYVGTSTGLKAFDASGVTGCSGNPVTCLPLWTAPTATGTSIPAVGNGLVYVGANRLYAFDAAGQTNCTGVPKQCGSVWSSGVYSTVGAPSVADGRVFVSTDAGIAAFDAAGTIGCTGTPMVCGPRWTSGPAVERNLAVAKGVLYAVGSKVEAYDAAGVTGCAGSPGLCVPMWTADLASPNRLPPAVANGVLYVPASDPHLVAFDATGTTGCTGVPTVCAPIWSAGLPVAPVTAPAVAHGVVYIGAGSGLVAFAPATYQRPVCPVNSHVGLSPCDLQDSYRLPSATMGSDQTIAIVDAFDDPNAEADLAAYRTAYGLPPCTTTNGCFKKRDQRGGTGPYPLADPGWSVEISLDLDMVSAACPRCHITLVESDDASTTNIVAAEQTAVAMHPAAVSNSFGGPEFSGQTSFDSAFSSKSAVVVVASGDNGFGVSFPASSPNVVAVGGTNLVADASPRGWSETAWSGTGSGCSAYEPKPLWQTDAGCTQRTVADVSAIAGSPGLAVYDTYGGVPGWITVQGTSASTPIVASVYALAPTVGSARSLWSNPGALFDVVSGSNGTCAGSYLCTALPGFDGPTGGGSPCGTGGFSILANVSADCATLSASAGLRASAIPKVAPLPSTPVCPAVPPGRVRCLALRVTG